MTNATVEVELKGEVRPLVQRRQPQHPVQLPWKELGPERKRRQEFRQNGAQ